MFKKTIATILCYSVISISVNARIFRKQYRDKEKILQSRDIRLKKNDKSYKGDVFYKPYYSLYVYKIKSDLKKDQAYMARISESILADNLGIIKKAYIPNVSPEFIRYPYPPSKIEDPRKNFLKDKRVPPYFKLHIERRHYHFEEIDEVEEKLLIQRKVKSRLRHKKYVEEDDEAVIDQKINAALVKADSYHFVTEIEAISKDEFTLNVELFWQIDSVFKESYTITEEDSVEQLAEVSTDLRKVLCGNKRGNLNVESNIERASVYIDDKFIGKTPLLFKYLPGIKYQLTLRKDGFSENGKEITVLNGKTLFIQEKLTKLITKGKIEVVTDPPGAKIYIGVDYKGLSPKTLENLPYGRHRIRVSKHNYVHRYQSVKISEEEPKAQVRLQLPEGDFQDYYKINPKVMGSFTYKDFFYIGMGVSLLSASGWLLYTVKSDGAGEAADSHIQAFGANSDSNYVTLQRTRSNTFANISSIFLISAIVSTVTAGYFYYLYLTSYDLEIADVWQSSNKLLASNYQGWQFHIDSGYKKDNNNQLSVSLQKRF